MSNSPALYERINLFVFFKQLNFLKRNRFLADIRDDRSWFLQTPINYYIKIIKNYLYLTFREKKNPLAQKLS